MVKFVYCFSGVNCGTPKRLPGSLPYVYTSTSYSAQFTFQCRSPLFTLVGNTSIAGNSVVTCGADGVWDFGSLRCEGREFQSSVQKILGFGCLLCEGREVESKSSVQKTSLHIYFG
jgi:hypothetical protein